MYYSGNIYIFPNGKKLFMYANSDLLHFPTTKIPRRVIRCITKNLFHSQIYKSHHYPRNFGDWKMQKPQISILEKFFPLEKKKIRRASKHTQSACEEASIYFTEFS